jgi:hypothetical protein
LVKNDPIKALSFHGIVGASRRCRESKIGKHESPLERFKDIRLMDVP